MKALAFTVAATVDLGDIRDYTEGEWSLAQARRYVQELRTGAGRPLSSRLKRQILRKLDRLELLLGQTKEIETERDAELKQADRTDTPAAAVLAALKGIGTDLRGGDQGRGAVALARKPSATGCLCWPDTNTLARYGYVCREQGAGKSGKPRLRTTMIQVAWLWLRHQPRSELSRWFQQRVAGHGGRIRKTMIAAMTRKLLVALWKYLTAGVVIEGAAMKTV